MMMRRLALWVMALWVIACPAIADSVVATRAIPAHAVIAAEDVTLVNMQIPNAAGALGDVIGRAAVTDIAAGRAVRSDQLAYDLRIERNALVALILQSGSMEIRTEGRALSQGGVGDVIEIMNVTSRMRISGTVRADGSVLVSPQR